MTDRLLLDTCAVIWIARNEPMSDEAIAALDSAFDDGEPALVSMITSWELGLLGSRGKLPAAVDPLDLFKTFVDRPGIAVEGLTPAILVGSSFLPGPVPRDPADRIIVATARALDLTIVTGDRLILEYGQAGYVRVLAY